MDWRYYCNGTLAWMMNNKVIVFLGLLSFSLFVSTLVLSSERSSLRLELDELRESMSSSTTANSLATDQAVSTTPQTTTTTASPSTESSSSSVSPGLMYKK
ncbi:unnamed protein product [Euphydryas editha]|uniref:Uncharacterized protein n=1 Tax=Euphydryas editha TaxID=104508 RepID=A0AAU9THV3_EUPED|nr:unnamed protein product [Euphydryas editha]